MALRSELLINHVALRPELLINHVALRPELWTDHVLLYNAYSYCPVVALSPCGPNMWVQNYLLRVLYWHWGEGEGTCLPFLRLFTSKTSPSLLLTSSTPYLTNMYLPEPNPPPHLLYSISHQYISPRAKPSSSPPLLHMYLPEPKCILVS